MKSKTKMIFVIIALLGAALGGTLVLILTGDGGGVSLGQTFVVDYDEALDFSATDRRHSFGPIDILLSARRPILAREKAGFSLCILRDGQKVRDLAPEMTFNMKMNMGHLNYRLLPTADGCYSAEALLPVCMSGTKRWYARVRFTSAGKTYEKVFIFDVQ